MQTLQFEKALIESTKGLPKDILKEILDFILFIREKRINKPMENISTELTRLNISQISHLEQEFKDYKQIYPNE